MDILVSPVRDDVIATTQAQFSDLWRIAPIRAGYRSASPSPQLAGADATDRLLRLFMISGAGQCGDGDGFDRQATPYACADRAVPHFIEVGHYIELGSSPRETWCTAHQVRLGELHETVWPIERP